MTAESLKARFPNASEAFLRRNAGKTGRVCPVCGDPIYNEATEHTELGLAHFNCAQSNETDHHRPLQDTEPEHAVCDESVGEAEGEAAGATRFRISIVSHRRILLDPDNLCPKYLLDCLKYAGLIPDDSPDQITLTVSQQKCAQGEERTVIEIET